MIHDSSREQEQEQEAGAGGRKQEEIIGQLSFDSSQLSFESL